MHHNIFKKSASTTVLNLKDRPQWLTTNPKRLKLIEKSGSMESNEIQFNQFQEVLVKVKLKFLT